MYVFLCACIVLATEKGELFLVKAYLHRHGIEIRANENPELALMEACGCVTGKKAQAWFWHAGYIWDD